MKRCTLCKLTKPLDEFGAKRAARDGRSPWCRSCCSGKNAAKYQRGALAAERRTRLDESRLPAGMKRCPGCGAVKPTTGFYRDRASASGISTRCSECVKAETTAYRRANPDKAAEATRRWWLANREYVNAYNRRWAAANPERAREQDRRYALKHRAEIIARVKAWGAANPVRARDLRLGVLKRYRERLKSLPGGTIERFVIFERDDWTCQICGSALGPDTATIDHIIPVSKPGSANTDDNLQTLCMSCNARKGASVA